MPDADHALSEIRRLAQAALQQPDLPPSLSKTLREIAALAQSEPGDTPEASDLPQTENQTL